MGRDKALMEVGGEPLVARVARAARAAADEVLLIAPDSKCFESLGLPIVCEETPGLGPLEGLRVGLAAARHDWALVLACDLPNLEAPVLQRLLDFRGGVDAVVPQTARGLQPLCALYHKRVLGQIEAALKEGERALHIALEGVQLVSPTAAEMGVGEAFFDNLNTPEDVKRWQRD